MFGFDNKAQNHDDSSGMPEPSGAPSLPQDQPAHMSPAPVPEPTFLEDHGADEGSSGWIGDDTNSNQAATSSSLEEPASVVMNDDSQQPSDDPSQAYANNDDLLAIKQNALHQLSPLVGHLDQSPEEKFKTTMMMIQASDDQSLIPAAYDAANAIQSEKAKAQALLDIVNEINYFTQHHQG